MAEPLRYLAENARIGLNVVEAARAGAGASADQPFVKLRLSARSGPGLTEDRILTAPLEPTNEGYALAKIMTMRLVEYAAREDASLAWRTLIPCNLYGPHDKYDPRHSHLLPAIIHQAASGQAGGSGQRRYLGRWRGAARIHVCARPFAGAIPGAGRAAGAAAGDECRAGVDHSINDYYRIAAEVIDWRAVLARSDAPGRDAAKLLDISHQQGLGLGAGNRAARRYRADLCALSEGAR